MSRFRRKSGPPSSQATQRLRDSLRVELGELSVRFEEAQLRSDALRRLGRREDAVDALEESRELLRTYQARVEQALSGAAVEREAEWVMAEAAHAERLADLDDNVIDLDEVRARRGEDRQARLRRLPATLSAAAASVLVLGMAVASLRAPSRAEDPTTLAAADGLLDAGDSGQGDGPTPRTRYTAKPLPYGFSSEAEVLDAIGADDPVIDALLTRRRDLLSRLSGTVAVAPSLLEELQEITGRLAAEGLDEELLEWLDEFEAQQPDRPEAEQPGQPDQPEQPAGDDTAEDPTPEEPTSDDGADDTEDDDGVFRGFGEGDGESDEESGGGAGAEGSGGDNAKSGEDDDGSLLG